MSDDQLTRVLAASRIVQAVVSISAALYCVFWLVRERREHNLVPLLKDETENWRLAYEASERRAAELERELEVAYTPFHEQPDTDAPTLQVEVEAMERADKNGAPSVPRPAFDLNDM